MITSASGWRKIFAASGDENDTTAEIGASNTLISALTADTFADYIITKKSNPIIIVGQDSRPTGTKIAETILRVLISRGLNVKYAGIIAAPEIMAYSRINDAFIYISASHNPIGHNGIKFGLNDGGVLNGEENLKLVTIFEKKCTDDILIAHLNKVLSNSNQKNFDSILSNAPQVKEQALESYRDFSKQVITGTSDKTEQDKLFNLIKKTNCSTPLGIVCDFNGSARTVSIDESFIKDCGLNFYSINNKPGQIVHEIIPEPENLIYCAQKIDDLQTQMHKDALLGYMPDCDGDRGNIVFFDKESNKSRVLKAQEVFALSVLSELAWANYTDNNKKLAVAVNCPTSMRIEEIASSFNADVFRAEVGEANVVNLAREKRLQGYTVRILGEGSNGGNITHPAAVRDPVNTLFALIKLLMVKDTATKKGLFHLWCSLSNQEYNYRDDFSLTDILKTLPVYTTTGVSEQRAVLHITKTDHAILKTNFQKIFEKEWDEKKEELKSKYNIHSYIAVSTNGTIETKGITNYSLSKKGGLKIQFIDDRSIPVAFIWMRGSGTEPVFRVMCDIKGDNQKAEAELLDWETQMILKADKA